VIIENLELRIFGIEKATEITETDEIGSLGGLGVLGGSELIL
jgi:hypothetical protein